MHTDPGKPYRPLKAGVAPSWLRMKSSAIASSSPVEIPGRRFFSSSACVAARIRPPSAMISISRADLSCITCQLLLAHGVLCANACYAWSGTPSECAHGFESALLHLGHFAYCVNRYDRSAGLTVPGNHRLGLLAINGKATTNGFRLIVLSPYERATTLLATASRFAAGVRRLARVADRAARKPLHELLVFHLEQ